jgi:protein involved in polysaccharide export with SLBB domain
VCLLVSFARVLAAEPRPFSNEDAPDLKSISVTIGGSFLVTGTFPASPQERVDQFLTRTCVNAQYGKDVSFQFSKRNIVLIRSPKEIIPVDLLKFQLTGDFVFNPYLKNGDVIVIPPHNIDINFVSIEGAVAGPATFQFVDGDRLSDAILFAQGIDPSYQGVTKALINRLNSEGNKEQEDTIAISDNPKLFRGDRIRVLAEDDQRKNYTVLVDGEVVHPGAVFITRSSTTLRKVIEKTGGFKPSADLNRAEVIRGANVFRSALFSEDFENLLMGRMSKISLEDSAAFMVDNKLRILRGNGGVDFNKVFDENATDGSFIVKSGDYILIPEKVDLVYVFGQVNSPGYIPYLKGQNFNYYIQKAGGVGITAKHEIYLIKGKTRNWIQLDKNSSNPIESGDYIWIPKKPTHQLNYYLQEVGFLASIITSLATVILLFSQFHK